jgi:hypothetical protein
LKTYGRNKRRKSRVKINMSEAQLLKEIKQLKINQKKIEKNQKNIEKKLDKAIGNANGQPDAEDQIEVWDDEEGLPADIRIAKVIKEAKKAGDNKLRRIQVGKVEEILGRKRTRTLEIMRKLDRKHENLTYKNLGGNKGSYLYYK